MSEIKRANPLKKVLKTVPGTQSPLSNCQLLSSHFTDKDFEAWRG